MTVQEGALGEVCAWLAAGAGGPSAAETIETHIGCVFLIGPFAYKLKKAIDLGYLDFSTPHKRQAAIRREFELNRANAPGLYVGVRMVTRGADGALAFDGAGAPLEAVLQMRRFDQAQLLSNQPQTVAGDFAEALGRRIADIHAAAPVRPRAGGLAGLVFVAQSNAGHLRALPALAGRLAEQLIETTAAALERGGTLLEARRAAGFARRCHGDLHLGNLFVEQGRPVLFDCIEFNDALSDIDVLYDLAFLVMDLTFRERREGAVRVLNGYLDQAARWAGEAVFDGLAAMPLFLSARAAVRAHVSAQMGQDDKGRAYLLAAIEHLQPSAPRLFAVGGLSGSGKSTVARALAPQVGAAPGAVVLRSDEIRKRLFKAGPRDRLPPQAYGAGTSEAVYGAMLEAARRALAAGRTVVLDAVFMREDERARARALAEACGAAFAGGWLAAPAEVLRTRVAGRRGDASDADVAVLEAQLMQDAGAIDWLRLDAARAPEDAVSRLARA